MFTSCIFYKISACPVQKSMLVTFLWRITFFFLKTHCYKFIDNSFTHFGTLPEEILPARQGLRLLSSTCHIGWASTTSHDVAKWQLPMSAKMKPREEKKRMDRNFILPSISKWLLSALHQSGEMGTVHFYSRGLECGGVFLGKQGGSTVHYAGWITGRIVTMITTL